MGNEIEAMGALDQALSALEPDERGRVLTWAVSKFSDGQVKLGAPGGSLRDGGANPDEENGDGAQGINRDQPQTFDRISDLMDAANPASGVDYVLLGSYWFQVVQEAESFTGHQVNSALKDLGHGSSNITTAYNNLKSRKPPLARQIQKSGTSKQARKQYRLTAEGIKVVDRMLAGKVEE